VLTVLMTSEVPSTPEPSGTGHVSATGCGHAVPAVAARYCAKLKVVPDLSALLTVVIAMSGSCLPRLSVAISGAFYRVILPSKISARVRGAS
jgi:hypothetical protein